MTEKKIKKEFLEFLKQNNALKEYRENLIKHQGKFHPEEDIIQIIIDPLHTLLRNKETYYNIINDSFIWGETPQGHNYWSELNLQWNKNLCKQATKTLP